MNTNIDLTIPKELQNILKDKKVAIAFSGGVDSSYLLYAAKTLNLDFQGYYINSQFQPEFEMEDALKLTKELNIDIKIIPLNVLENKTVTNNHSNRCYDCKNTIFTTIVKEAKKDGFEIILDGTNASDDPDNRPGMKALEELKVLSPLRIANLTKDDIRKYSKEANLFTWNKPAYACLATRIPTSMEITEELLQKIENSEKILFEMGFEDFRVRVLDNKIAKLEFTENQFLDVIRERFEIAQKLKPFFHDVYLDLKAR